MGFVHVCITPVVRLLVFFLRPKSFIFWLREVSFHCTSSILNNAEMYGTILHYSLQISYAISVTKWYASILAFTRKLCYRKDGRAMRAI